MKNFLKGGVGQCKKAFEKISVEVDKLIKEIIFSKINFPVNRLSLCILRYDKGMGKNSGLNMDTLNQSPVVITF